MEYAFGLLYTLSSAGETLAVKALNYAPVPLILPTYTAFLSNQMWILMLPLYVYVLQGKAISITWNHMYQYAFMGILTFAVTLLRNISLNTIPGSVFSLLISTSIVFNIILSYIFLKKTFNIWHFGAAASCLSSAACIGLSALLTKEEGVADYTLGIPTAIAAAFFVAAITVFQESIQKTWDDYTLRVVEISIVSSFIAFLMILVYSIFSKELIEWKPSIDASTQTKEGLILVISISILLPVLKLITRNSKYSTIQHSNAFFFEFVQSSGSLLTSITSILIFKEPWGPAYIAAFFLLSIAFAMYSKAKLVAKEQIKAEQKTTSTHTIKDQVSVVNPINHKEATIEVTVTWK